MSRKRRYSLQHWQKNGNKSRIIQAQKDAAAAKKSGKKPRKRKKHRYKAAKDYANRQETFYGARDALIKAAGFPDYAAYRQSDLWKKIRAAVLERDKHLCQICWKPGNHAHHRQYTASAILGTIIDQITCLCEECHKAIEFSEDGVKRMTRRSIEKAYRERACLFARQISAQKNKPKPTTQQTFEDYWFSPVPVRSKGVPKE